MNKEDIIRIAQESGIAKVGQDWVCWEVQLERFAQAVAAKERNACVEICRRVAQDLEKAGAKFAVSLMEGVGNTIQARGEE